MKRTLTLEFYWCSDLFRIVSICCFAFIFHFSVSRRVHFPADIIDENSSRAILWSQFCSNKDKLLLNSRAFEILAFEKLTVFSTLIHWKTNFSLLEVLNRHHSYIMCSIDLRDRETNIPGLKFMQNQPNIGEGSTRLSFCAT
jgi:hypothetical protein